MNEEKTQKIVEEQGFTELQRALIEEVVKRHAGRQTRWYEASINPWLVLIVFCVLISIESIVTIIWGK